MVKQPKKQNNQQSAAFRQISSPLLKGFKSELERINPKSNQTTETDTISELVRFIHTLKETATESGIQPVVDLSDAVEDYLYLYCWDQNIIQPQQKELLEHSHTLLCKIIDQQGKKNVVSETEQDIKTLIGQLETNSNAIAAVDADLLPDKTTTESQPDFYPEMLALFVTEGVELIETVEETLLFLEEQSDDYQQTESLNTCFRALHTLKGNSNLIGIKPLENLIHAAESLLANKVKSEHGLSDLELQLMLDTVDAFKNGLNQLSTKGQISENDLAATRQRLEEMNLHLEQPEESVEIALDLSEQQNPITDAPLSQSIKQTELRVGLGKLDQLIDLVGELVTVTNRVSHFKNNKLNNELETEIVIDQLNQVTSDIRDLTMSIRLIPLSFTFRRMSRLVRDISQSLGKPVKLSLAGEKTEMDKTLVEQIIDPLLHIIRNAIGHGIESQEERKQVGKPEIGNILLEASQEGDEILIRIQDDGRGLDREKILTTAQERGLIDPQNNPSDAIVFDTIFASGFTTSDAVSEISGRGIGLDVVKSNLNKISGRIEIASEPGQGTTFLLRLPVTMSIIETLLVRISEEHFAIPLSLIQQCIELTAADREQQHGRDIIRIQGQIVPYIRLRDQLQIKGEVPAIEQIVIVEQNSQKFGLVVDQALEKHQTMIKPLGKIHANARCFLGATFLGDGSVALILDIHQIFEQTIKVQNKLNRE